MYRFHAALLLSVLLFLGCTGSKVRHYAALTTADETIADTIDASDEMAGVMPEGADELFDDFVYNFASNLRLQLERIDFPLRVLELDGGEHQLARKQWKMETFFMKQDYYTLIFDGDVQMEQAKDTAINEAVVERIMLEDSIVKQFCFHRKGGQWRLTEIHEQALQRNANAQFLSFYRQFVCDSVFQYSSLSEQIAFVGPDDEDDFGQVEGVITPDFWSAFAPELPSDRLWNIVYGLQDPAATEKIFVLRGIANGLETELTFSLRGGRWRLVKLTT